MGYVRQTTKIECPGYGEDVTVKPKEERKKNIEPRNKDIIKKGEDISSHQNKNFKEVIIFYL